MNVRHISAMALAGTFLARTASTQQPRERDDVHLRDNCRLAAQVLTTGHPDPHYAWARDIISACDESGGPALAAVWQSATDDPQELGRLVYVTTRLRDQRILDALLAIARDRTRPAAIRLSTLQVLISYFAPGAYVSIVSLEHPPFGSPLGWETEFAPTEGAVPLASSARDEILSLTTELARSDQDSTVRDAARFVTEGLEAILRARPG